MEDATQSSGIWHWLRIAVIGRRPKRTLARLVVLAVVCVVAFKFILIPVRVAGVSMEPTYHAGGVNFINRLAYVRGSPQRGDVVGIRMSTNANTGIHVMLLKRVVGLPGESVSFAGGHVCIDGDRQEEPYLKKVTDWEMPPKTLGPDEYYVVGDNRSMPPEDHVHGIAQRSQIVGRVLWKKE